jgi:hypothetical protein
MLTFIAKAPVLRSRLVGDEAVVDTRRAREKLIDRRRVDVIKVSILPQSTAEPAAALSVGDAVARGCVVTVPGRSQRCSVRPDCRPGRGSVEGGHRTVGH